MKKVSIEQVKEKCDFLAKEFNSIPGFIDVCLGIHDNQPALVLVVDSRFPLGVPPRFDGVTLLVNNIDN